MPTEKRLPPAQPPASILQQFGNLRLPGSSGRPGNTGIGGGLPSNMNLSSMSMPTPPTAMPSGPRRAPLAPVGPSAAPAPTLPSMPGMMLPPGTPGFFDAMRKEEAPPTATRGPTPSPADRLIEVTNPRAPAQEGAFMRDLISRPNQGGGPVAEAMNNIPGLFDKGPFMRDLISRQAEEQASQPGSPAPYLISRQAEEQPAAPGGGSSPASLPLPPRLPGGIDPRVGGMLPPDLMPPRFMR